jgi:hypothetical protein
VLLLYYSVTAIFADDGDSGKRQPIKQEDESPSSAPRIKNRRQGSDDDSDQRPRRKQVKRNDSDHDDENRIDASA